jgi:hypothetical protein
MDRAPNPVPAWPKVRPGDRAQIIGEPGVFLVVRIDRKRHCADLLLMGPNARLELGIHLSSILPYAQTDAASRQRGLGTQPAAEKLQGED